MLLEFLIELNALNRAGSGWVVVPVAVYALRFWNRYSDNKTSVTALNFDPGALALHDLIHQIPVPGHLGCRLAIDAENDVTAA